MRSVPLQLRATEGAQSAHRSLAAGPLGCQLASPDPPSESQALQPRPYHTLPTATRAQNHVSPGLPIERLNSESSVHLSKVRCVVAARPSGNVVRSLHRRDQPATVLSFAEIEEMPGANCKCQQRFVSQHGWKASAQTHPH